MIRVTNRSCVECGEVFGGLPDTKYCRKCLKSVCCYSDRLDSFNRQKCNSTCPLVYKDGKSYCVGHWKMRQKFCKVCDKLSSDIGHDDYGYCADHVPDPKRILALMINKFPYIPVDVLKTMYNFSQPQTLKISWASKKPLSLLSTSSSHRVLESRNRTYLIRTAP